MARKGILWLPVAIGIILLAEILVFSLAFNKATVFSREVTDANVIFEGSELETYVRSIDDSIQISMAQALYNFYEAHKGETWESYGSNSVPDPNGEVSSSAQIYEGLFFTAHQNIPDKAGQAPLQFNPSTIGNGTLNIGAKGVSMKFLQMDISKHFGIADFKRTFVPESTLATSFGEMMGAIQNLISGKVVDDQVLQAIGPSKGKMKTSCGTPDRFTDATIRKTYCVLGTLDPIPYPKAGTTPSSKPQDACNVDGVSSRELHSYLVDDAMTPKANQKFAGMSVDTQTQSTGHVQYCNMDKRRKAGCSCSDPCRPPPMFDPAAFPRMSEPTPDQVHEFSHGTGFSGASALIKQHLYTRMICLEGELDYASTDYTSAFDGENGGLTINKDTINTQAQVDVVSDSNVPLGGECPGITTRVCNPRLCGGSDQYFWECPLTYKRTDVYNHVASVSVDARFQDDGFVYGFSASKDAGGTGHGGQTADTIKLLFRIVTGNKQLS